MNELIGFWLISLAIVILFVGIESTFSIKEKIMGIIGFMAFITLLYAGVILMVGGA